MPDLLVNFSFCTIQLCLNLFFNQSHNHALESLTPVFRKQQVRFASTGVSLSAGVPLLYNDTPETLQTEFFRTETSVAKYTPSQL